MSLKAKSAAQVLVSLHFVQTSTIRLPIRERKLLNAFAYRERRNSRPKSLPVIVAVCTLLKLRSERKEKTQKTNFYFVDCCAWTHTPVNDPIKNKTWTVSGQSKCFFEAEVKLNSSGLGFSWCEGQRRG